MDLDYLRAWYALLPAKELSKFVLIKEYELEELYYIINNGYMSDNLIYRDKYKLLTDEYIRNFKHKLTQHRANFVLYGDENYPKMLYDLTNPPSVLYYIGNIEVLNYMKCIGIVGSRKASQYGLQVTKYLVKALSIAPSCIVSGGAKGIDAESHRIAIEEGLSTCAVLGCGVDVIYPAVNRELFSKIKNSGCIISEFPLGTKPLAYNFPQRNRIISGLSSGIIVVEASESSGSLITARLAGEQGKQIVAVPGSIFSTSSSGCHTLIRDGVAPFTSISELLHLFNIKGQNKKEINDTLKWQIMKLLNDKPVHIDEIIRNINIDTETIYELLFEMQFKNEVMCILGNYYVNLNRN